MAAWLQDLVAVTSGELVAQQGMAQFAVLGLGRSAVLVVLVVEVAQAVALCRMLARDRENIYRRPPTSTWDSEEISMWSGGGEISLASLRAAAF